MYRVRMGIGDVSPGIFSSDPVVDPATGLTIDCDSWSNIFNATCWGFGTTGLNVTAPAVAPAPTQAQLDTVAASSDPGTSASALVQNLTNAAVTQTQANNAAANPVSFCGPGSNQWISGIDNCVLIAGIVVGWVVLNSMSGRRR